jgi:hypothetical protein
MITGFFENFLVAFILFLEVSFGVTLTDERALAVTFSTNKITIEKIILFIFEEFLKFVLP